MESWLQAGGVSAHVCILPTRCVIRRDAYTKVHGAERVWHVAFSWVLLHKDTRGRGCFPSCPFSPIHFAHRLIVSVGGPAFANRPLAAECTHPSSQK